jgi:glycosyltransferase involved in cell wall biosynthesis
VVDDLAWQHPVRLLIAGDGEGRTQVTAAAAAVNGRHGEDIVVVAGNLLDPRPAYDAADIVLGMGSSALKGMAFAKPLVVQGTGGYWRLLDERSADTFLVQGWFGHGATEPDALRAAVEYLIANRDRAAELGAFGRDLVVRRFSLENAADILLSIYDQAIDELPSPGTRWRSLGQSAYEVTKFRAVVGARRVMRPPAPPQVQPS